MNDEPPRIMSASKLTNKEIIDRMPPDDPRDKVPVWTKHQPGKLSAQERTRLKHCEGIIAEGFKAYIRTGQALKIIRNQKLFRDGAYREGKPTSKANISFEDYCSVVWHISASRARQIIDGFDVVERIKTVTDVTPMNEAQSREMVKVKDDELLFAIWRQVLANGNPTAKRIRAVVKEMTSQEPATEQDLRELDEALSAYCERAFNLMQSAMDKLKEIGNGRFHITEEVKAALMAVAEAIRDIAHCYDQRQRLTTP